MSSSGQQLVAQPYLNVIAMDLDAQCAHYAKLGVRNSTSLRASLGAPLDPTGDRWRRRFFTSPEVVRKWAYWDSRRDTHDHRDRQAALNNMEQLKFFQPEKTKEGDSSIIDKDKHAHAWDQSRGKVRAAFRRALLAGVEVGEMLGALLQAAKNTSHGNPRAVTLLRRHLDDEGLMKLPAPVHADLVLFEFDTSYRTARYGQDSHDLEWDKCISRLKGEDSETMQGRFLSGFLCKFDNKITEADVYTNPTHTRAYLQRVFEGLRNDEDDKERGYCASNAFFAEWEEVRNGLERADPRYTPADLNANLIISRKVIPRENTYYEERSHREMSHPETRETRNRSRARTAGAVTGQTNPPPGDTSTPSQPPAPGPYAAAVMGTPPATAPAPAPADSERHTGGRGYTKGSGRGGPGGKGGRGANPYARTIVVPNSSHTNEPPPRDSRPNSAHFVDVPGYGRTCPHPAGATGNPRGDSWTAESWRVCMTDLDKLTSLSAGPAGVATRLARPGDATMANTRGGRERSDENNVWAPDACAYCFYRAPMPDGAASADAWWYGNGKGNHSPYRCQCFKRYLAEGGDKAMHPEHAAALQSCLRFPRRDA